MNGTISVLFRSKLLTVTTTIVLFCFIVIYPLIASYKGGINAYFLIPLVIFRIALFYFSFQMLGYWLLRFAGSNSATHNKKSSVQTTNSSNVAILIPVKDEPDHLVIRMLEHLRSIKYPNKSIFLIDNSTDDKTDTFRQYANDLNLVIKVVRKADWHGYKAGALNVALSMLGAEYKYVLILDIDHAPRPEILDRLVKHIEDNQDLTFVQSPQRYDESFSTLVSAAYCYKQRIFYDHICPGLSYNGSLFILGTNVIIRKSRLDEIGGFDSTSLTEDLRTSVILQKHGCTGEYINETLTMGYPPLDLHSYSRQQRRWAIGTLQNFFFTIRLFWKSPSTLTFNQWLLFLGWNGTFYFHGVFAYILLLFSILHLLISNYRPFIISDMLILALFLTTTAATMLHEHRVTSVPWRKLFLYKAIFFGDFLISVQALIDLLWRRNLVFEVTKKTKISSLTATDTFMLFHAFLAASLSIAISYSLYHSSYPSSLVWLILFFIQSAILVVVSFIDRRVAMNERIDYEMEKV